MSAQKSTALRPPQHGKPVRSTITAGKPAQLTDTEPIGIVVGDRAVSTAAELGDALE